MAAVRKLFLILVDLGRRPAAVLSGGEQQALVIGRALMADPRLFPIERRLMMTDDALAATMEGS